MLVFTYGTLTLSATATAVDSRAKLVDIATLHDWALMSCGYLTVEKELGSTIEGIVWDVPDLKRFDSYEGYPLLYSRVEVDIGFNVSSDSGAHFTKAWVYTMNPPHNVPRDSPHNSARAGYDEHGLDTKQIDEACKRVAA